jgi:hypothetical protein
LPSGEKAMLQQMKRSPVSMDAHDTICPALSGEMIDSPGG